MLPYLHPLSTPHHTTTSPPLPPHTEGEWSEGGGLLTFGVCVVDDVRARSVVWRGDKQ